MTIALKLPAKEYS